MSEEKQSKKVLPGVGCGGIGCIVVILLMAGAFIAGVKYKGEPESKLDQIIEKVSDEVEEKFNKIKDKVD